MNYLINYIALVYCNLDFIYIYIRNMKPYINHVMKTIERAACGSP